MQVKEVCMSATSNGTGFLLIRILRLGW